MPSQCSSSQVAQERGPEKKFTMVWILVHIGKPATTVLETWVANTPKTSLHIEQKFSWWMQQLWDICMAPRNPRQDTAIQSLSIRQFTMYQWIQYAQMISEEQKCEPLFSLFSATWITSSSNLIGWAPLNGPTNVENPRYPYLSDSNIPDTPSLWDFFVTRQTTSFLSTRTHVQ